MRGVLALLQHFRVLILVENSVQAPKPGFRGTFWTGRGHLSGAAGTEKWLQQEVKRQLQCAALGPSSALGDEGLARSPLTRLNQHLRMKLPLPPAGLPPGSAVPCCLKPTRSPEADRDAPTTAAATRPDASSRNCLQLAARGRTSWRACECREGFI